MHVVFFNPLCWGDSPVTRVFPELMSQVKSQLQDVVRVWQSRDAFAALRRDGSVVTWGEREAGGDSWIRGAVPMDFASYPKGRWGCGSKPMVPFWGRCTAHFSLIQWSFGMFTGGRRS